VKPVRVSAKAIIVRNKHLLVLMHRDTEGLYYTLPGGGQEYEEPLLDALRRECMEEIGIEVAPGELRYVRDYIGSHHEFASEDHNTHQLELMFECAIAPGAEPRAGAIPDDYQIGIAWLPLATLDAHRLYPKALIPILMNGQPRTGPVYLGDVN
jgi:8-oxo-dGTP pyrophosphatase MutT (NUDIX family)